MDSIAIWNYGMVRQFVRIMPDGCDELEKGGAEEFVFATALFLQGDLLFVGKI